MTESCGQLSEEDLARFRMIITRRESYRIAPEKYSAQDIEGNEMSHARLMGEIVKRYNLDDTRRWGISAFTGVMVYGEWDD